MTAPILPASLREHYRLLRATPTMLRRQPRPSRSGATTSGVSPAQSGCRQARVILDNVVISRAKIEGGLTGEVLEEKKSAVRLYSWPFGIKETEIHDAGGTAVPNKQTNQCVASSGKQYFQRGET